MKNIERHNILAENAIRAYVRNRIDEIVTKNNRFEEVVRNLVKKDSVKFSV